MSWLAVSLQTTDEAVDWVRTLANPEQDRSIAITEQKSDASGWQWQICVYLPQPAHTSLQKLLDRLSGLYRTQQISEPETHLVNTLPLPVVALPQRIGRFVIVPDAMSMSDQSVSNQSVLDQPVLDQPVLDQPVSDQSMVSDARKPLAGKTTTTDLPIYLTAQFAFGSGLHPATQLALRMIERYVTPGLQALDLGSGSGILTIAMARLGASVLALDNDQTSVLATQTAIDQNQVRAAVQEGSLGQGSQLGHWMGGSLSHSIPSIQPQAMFDLIVANLLGRIHLQLAPDYRAALKSPGQAYLITSGYTIDYELDINQAMLEVGLERIDRDAIDDWVVQVHQLPAPNSH
ncbi:MAG: 50S ribosomal protein L11 methyltransferase [Elainella sp. Prado103]|jgi:ribosomal protein L11 methyltransferase|nr:50S ribosomal protein L11 methyltransferase [Elainella sp. Prado103]